MDNSNIETLFSVFRRIDFFSFLFLVVFLAPLVAFHRMIRPRSKGWCLWGAMTVMSLLVFAKSSDESVLLGVLVLFGSVPAGIFLYRKWLLGQLTETERMPGGESFRAWFSPGRVFFALIAAFVGACGIGVWLESWNGLWITIPLSLLVLGIYPIGLTLMHSETATEMPHNSEQRQVLEMLREGTINVEESQQLLTALATGDGLSRVVAPVRCMPVFASGMVLLLLGFFIPWFYVNAATELPRLMGQVLPMSPDVTAQLGNMVANMGGTSVYAGDLANGLGWFVLLFGGASAVLPFFLQSQNLEVRQVKLLRMLLLASATLLLLYVGVRTLRYVHVGWLVTLLALVCLWIEVVMSGLNRNKERASG